MRTPRPGRSVSRRAAVTGIGIGGLAAAASRLGASAQDASADLAGHPIIGAWMVTTPIGPSMAVFSADGINIQGVPTTQAGPQGVEFVSAQVGTWEPDGDRRVHFTGVQFHTRADGTLISTVTIDGHPRVSEDGQSIIDDAPETTVTIRDAANVIVDVVRGLPPATGIRMGVGLPGLPAGTPEAGTPAS